MKKLFRTLFAAALCCLTFKATDACTNFIITRGASSDGSVMVSYAADSHQLYGALYKTFAGRYKPGTMLPVYDWASGRYLGEIPQAAQTYATIGNMNEHSLIIAESTYGGREELADSTGRIDYGSLIYITLQRAKTAREAIRIIVDLANTYGYASSGESFSIADQNEAWIMELIGKGCELDAEGNNTRKGIVWVARRIPDGYVSAHANQSRITTFPLDDPENCLYAPDVISFAREKGYFNGPDEEFSFCDAYAPADFGTVRGCDARVWAFFRTVADDMDQYTDYAMGNDMSNRMPLWVKPRTKDPGHRCGRTCPAVPLAPDGFRSGRRNLPERACGSNPADRILVRGTGPALAAGRHGHPLVRGGRRSDILPDADLLLGNRGSRMFPRGQRHDAQIFAHVGILALQPRNQLRLSALRSDRGRHPQGG